MRNILAHVAWEDENLMKIIISEIVSTLFKWHYDADTSYYLEILRGLFTSNKKYTRFTFETFLNADAEKLKTVKDAVDYITKKKAS